MYWDQQKKKYKESNIYRTTNKQSQCYEQETTNSSVREMGNSKSLIGVEDSAQKKSDFIVDELYRKPEIKVWEGRKTRVDEKYVIQQEQRNNRQTASTKYNVRCTGICADCRRDVCLEDVWKGRNQD